MRATIYGETSKAKEYKKALVVKDCGLGWFQFSNHWKAEWSDKNNSFLLYALRGRLMARHCYIEIG
jgi:hypothetical protein